MSPLQCLIKQQLCAGIQARVPYSLCEGEDELGKDILIPFKCSSFALAG